MTETIARMPAMTRAVLRSLAEVGHFDLRKVSEPLRQRLIDLGIAEPPLVDVDADRVFLTEAGRAALASPVPSPSRENPHGRRG